MRLVKSLINKSVEKLGYKISRIAPTSKDTPTGNQKIGMETCIKGLYSRGFYPKMLIDIGGARGDWTRLALIYWPDTTYFLVEPLEEWESNLKSLKRQYRNTDYILAAAGPEKGEGKLGVSEDPFGSSLLHEGVFSREIPVITIDDLLEEGRIEQPDFMKLDVQGFELFVLQGAIKTMKKCSLILLELQFFRFMPSMKLLHESIVWMVDHGFIPYEIVDVLRRPLDGAMGQCDILFCKVGHPLLADSRWESWENHSTKKRLPPSKK